MRLLCLMLCFGILLGNLPAAALAEEGETTGETLEVIPEDTQPETTEAATEETTEESAEEPTEETTEEPTEEPTEAIPEVMPPVRELLLPDTEGWPSDEELFAIYAQGILYGNLPAVFGTSAYDRLTDTNVKLAYEALKPELQKIARGERESTSFTLGYAFENVHFTDGTVRDLPAELPVAFQGSEFDAGLLMRSLVADMPYEMYWFAKNLGMAASYVPVGGKLNVTLEFCVAGNCSPDGSAGGFVADKTKTGAAAAAAANARSVAANADSLSDYEKLLYFKEYICGAVEYDWVAYFASLANSQYPAIDADPWQLIHVFDGKPGTNVVCEGYSKAFQYLCDLAKFSKDENGNERVVCYSVSGTMDGGGHMWNIVTIDGEPYLADLTNSDDDSIGENGGLFLVGGEKDASGNYTFSVGGANTTYVYDQKTRNLWGSDVLTLSTNSAYAPPCSHSYDAWETTKAATATSQGQEQRECSLCGDTQTRQLIPVGLTAIVEPVTVTTGAKPEDVRISLSASQSIGGAQVTDLELEYTITDESGKEYTLEQALATPGKYTITPKVKTP